MRDFRFRLGLVLPAVTLLLTTGTLARADLIFFKDGFSIYGKLMERRTLRVDSFSKESWVAPLGVYIDDGPRRFFFSYGQIQASDSIIVRPEDAIGTGRNRVILPDPGGIPIMMEVIDPGTFDEKWDRIYLYQTLGRA